MFQCAIENRLKKKDVDYCFNSSSNSHTLDRDVEDVLDVIREIKSEDADFWSLVIKEERDFHDYNV